MDPEHDRQAWEWWTGGAAAQQAAEAERLQKDSDDRYQSALNYRLQHGDLSPHGQRVVGTQGATLPRGCLLYAALALVISFGTESIMQSGLTLLKPASDVALESPNLLLSNWLFTTGRIFPGLVAIVLGITWLLNLGRLPGGGWLRVAQRAALFGAVLLVLSMVIASFITFGNG
jgi:hypothetical protein